MKIMLLLVFLGLQQWSAYGATSLRFPRVKYLMDMYRQPVLAALGAGDFYAHGYRFHEGLGVLEVEYGLELLPLLREVFGITHTEINMHRVRSPLGVLSSYHAGKFFPNIVELKKFSEYVRKVAPEKSMLQENADRLIRASEEVLLDRQRSLLQELQALSSVDEPHVAKRRLLNATLGIRIGHLQKVFPHLKNATLSAFLKSGFSHIYAAQADKIYRQILRESHVEAGDQEKIMDLVIDEGFLLHDRRRRSPRSKNIKRVARIKYWAAEGREPLLTAMAEGTFYQHYSFEQGVAALLYEHDIAGEKFFQEIFGKANTSGRDGRGTASRVANKGIPRDYAFLPSRVELAKLEAYLENICRESGHCQQVNNFISATNEQIRQSQESLSARLQAMDKLPLSKLDIDIKKRRLLADILGVRIAEHEKFNFNYQRAKDYISYGYPVKYLPKVRKLYKQFLEDSFVKEEDRKKILDIIESTLLVRKTGKSYLSAMTIDNFYQHHRFYQGLIALRDELDIDVAELVAEVFAIEAKQPLQVISNKERGNFLPNQRELVKLDRYLDKHRAKLTAKELEQLNNFVQATANYIADKQKNFLTEVTELTSQRRKRRLLANILSIREEQVIAKFGGKYRGARRRIEGGFPAYLLSEAVLLYTHEVRKLDHLEKSEQEKIVELLAELLAKQ